MRATARATTKKKEVNSKSESKSQYVNLTFGAFVLRDDVRLGPLRRCLKRCRTGVVRLPTVINFGTTHLIVLLSGWYANKQVVKGCK